MTEQEIKAFNEEYGIVEVVENSKVLYYEFLGSAHANIRCPKCGHSPAACREYSSYRLENFNYTEEHRRIANIIEHTVCCPLENQAHKYIYIYGEGVSGKTHLAQAICNQAREAFPKELSACINAVDFIKEIDEAKRFRATDRLVKKYAEYAYLIIDDIHKIANYKAAQNIWMRILMIRDYFGENITVFTSTNRISEWGEEAYEERLKQKLSYAEVYQLPCADIKRRQRKPDWKCICRNCKHQWKLFG